MRQREYKDICSRTEHRDETARVKNLRTGEVGTVVQCAVGDIPEVLLVRVNDLDVTSWSPEEVQEI